MGRSKPIGHNLGRRLGAHVRRKFFDAADRAPALGAIPVLRGYADFVSEIPEHRFRRDISSSEILAGERTIDNS
jgi:hypothetical protein